MIDTTQADVQTIQARLQALNQNRRTRPRAQGSGVSSSGGKSSQSQIRVEEKPTVASDLKNRGSVELPMVASPPASSVTSAMTSVGTFSAAPQINDAVSQAALSVREPQSSRKPMQAAGSPEPNRHVSGDWGIEQSTDIDGTDADRSPNHTMEQVFQQLNQSVHQVNSMSRALEAALQETAAIAHQLQHQRIRAAARGQRTRFDHWDALLVYDPHRMGPGQSYLPQIERSSQGEFILTGRPMVWSDSAQSQTPSSHPAPAQPAAVSPTAMASPSSQSLPSNGSSDQALGAIATHLRHRSEGQRPSPTASKSPNVSSRKHRSILDSLIRWFNPTYSSPPTASSTASSVASPHTVESSLSRQTEISSETSPINTESWGKFVSNEGLQRNPRGLGSKVDIARRAASPSSASPSSGLTPSLLGGLVVVAAAAIARMGLDWLLLAYPMFLPAVIAVLITPAAIAIYRSTIDPQSGFALGQRLLLIMVGLLLGGRF